MLHCPLQPNSSSVLHRVCTIYLSGRKIEEKERDKERENQKEYARESEKGLCSRTAKAKKRIQCYCIMPLIQGQLQTAQSRGGSSKESHERKPLQCQLQTTQLRSKPTTETNKKVKAVCEPPNCAVRKPRDIIRVILRS